MPTYSRMPVRHQMLQPIAGFSKSDRYRPIPPATVVAISNGNWLTRPPGRGAYLGAPVPDYAARVSPPADSPAITSSTNRP